MSEHTVILWLFMLLIMAVTSVIAAFVWVAMSRDDPWFNEEQAKADVEELKSAAAKEFKHRSRVRAIS